MGLREETAEKHRIAEQKEFNQRMFRGELTKEEYVNYLTQQSLIFNQIEFGNNLPSDSLRRSKNYRRFKGIKRTRKLYCFTLNNGIR